MQQSEKMDGAYIYRLGFYCDIGCHSSSRRNILEQAMNAIGIIFCTEIWYEVVPGDQQMLYSKETLLEKCEED